MKPVSADIHFKYICKNRECLNELWASLAQANTPNFLLICPVCNCINRPSLIKKVRVEYDSDVRVPSGSSNTTDSISPVFIRVSELLVANGFSKQEAKVKIDLAIKSGLKSKEEILRWCLNDN
jgi:hypothetical protein